MRQGICVAGHLCVDIIYPSPSYPPEGQLVCLNETFHRATGGCVNNTIMDMARLDPSMPLTALGIAGTDPEGDYVLEALKKYPNIDTSMLKRQGNMGYTLVITSEEKNTRTFFQYKGCEALFDEECIDWEKLNSSILHVGYIFLLSTLDEEDPEFGTRLARLLCAAREKGIKTSIDMVTVGEEHFKEKVLPALKYTDYCVINEIEAQRTTGVLLRDGSDRLYTENMEEALRRLREAGVSEWAVIHAPEGGFGMGRDGRLISMKSLTLPEGYIKGTTGAGDAFCAGVLTGAEKGYDLKDAIRLGICTAGASLSEESSVSGVRPIEETLKLWELYGDKTL